PIMLGWRTPDPAWGDPAKNGYSSPHNLAKGAADYNVANGTNTACHDKPVATYKGDTNGCYLHPGGDDSYTYWGYLIPPDKVATPADHNTVGQAVDAWTDGPLTTADGT